ncbi:MAG: fasciclin domain-containing protein [Arenibacterium sp.]
MWFKDLVDQFLPDDKTPPPAPTLSIAEIASGNDNFNILVAALNATGLTQTFLDPGDYTVFAPTDDAFRELATTTFGLDVSALTDDEVAGALVTALGAATVTDVLFYHVKAGASTVSHLQQEGTIDTLLSGASFDVSGDTLIDVDPEVENPAFIAGLTDIQATNGTIQAIDRVLLPIDVDEAGTRDTIADIAIGNDAFETLVAALVATGLDSAVADRDADLTVFAPTDDAFRDLADALGLDVSALSDAEVAGALVGAVGADLVESVLLHHVSPGTNLLADIQSDRLIETLEGTPIAFDGSELVDAEPDVGNAAPIAGLTDIAAANGVIHAIDGVILPVDLSPTKIIANGTRKDDVLYGGAANDRLFAGNGDDIVIGGDGKDKMAGWFGDDWMIGGAGADKIRGNFGDDTIIGGGGSDKVSGGFGKDTIIDGAGDDVYRGGLNSDTFDFTNFQGDNIVRDFRGHDQLVFSKADFATEQEVLDAASRSQGSTVIDSGTATVELTGVRSIDADDFIIV